MALPQSKGRSLTTFKVLSFDIFGTVIDEPASVIKALQPLVSQLSERHGAKHSPSIQVQGFSTHEKSFQDKNPTMPFEEVLATSYRALAKEWNLKASTQDVEAVFHHLCNSPPFADSIEALKILGSHYKLIALSNNSQAGLEAVMAGPLKDIEFDACLSAEVIGAYKPDLKNFEFLLKTVEEMGIGKEDLLHVAQGIISDHRPAKRMGLCSAWISRDRPVEEKGYDGVGEENEGEVTYQWRWHSLGDMARDVEAAFAKE